MSRTNHQRKPKCITKGRPCSRDIPEKYIKIISYGQDFILNPRIYSDLQGLKRKAKTIDVKFEFGFGADHYVCPKHGDECEPGDSECLDKINKYLYHVDKNYHIKFSVYCSGKAIDQTKAFISKVKGIIRGNEWDILQSS